MNATEVTIGLEVVRSKGDYVVGTVGKVLEIDQVKQRVKVSWGTCVKIDVVEPTSIPYEVSAYSYNPKTGKHSNPKYKRLG